MFIIKKLLIFVFCLLGLVGCTGKITNANLVNSLSDKVNQIKEYQVSASMKIMKDDVPIIYDLNIKYLDGFYAVELLNKENNSTQVILKNDSGVYVLNPLLNKCYKFNNNWPGTTSNGYLLHSIVKDIINDQEIIITNDKTNYYVESNVSHKTNYKWASQKVTISKETLLPSEVLIYDTNKKVLVNVIFKDFNLSPTLKQSDFNHEKTMTETILSLGEGIYKTSGKYGELGYVPVSSTLDETNTYSDKKVSSYKGEKSFVLIQSKISPNDELVVVDIYGEPIILDEVVGYLTDNTLSWVNEGIEYTIFMTNMEVKEMLEVANSIE